VDVDAGDLLPNERVLMPKRANAVVRYTDYGLERIGAMHVGLESFGWAGKEAVGGKLFLTNYRLLFKSHRINRLTGSFSIFLPSVQGARDSSRGVVRRATFTTSAQEFEFVVWGVGAFIAAVDAQRTRVDLNALNNVLLAAADSPATLGLGLAKSELLGKLLRDGRLSRVLSNIGEIAVDPFSLSTLVNVMEILELLQEE
jgi:hypothetical protein